MGTCNFHKDDANKYYVIEGSDYEDFDWNDEAENIIETIKEHKYDYFCYREKWYGDDKYLGETNYNKGDISIILKLNYGYYTGANLDYIIDVDEYDGEFSGDAKDWIKEETTKIEKMYSEICKSNIYNLKGVFSNGEAVYEKE